MVRYLFICTHTYLKRWNQQLPRDPLFENETRDSIFGLVSLFVSFFWPRPHTTIKNAVENLQCKYTSVSLQCVSLIATESLYFRAFKKWKTVKIEKAFWVLIAEILLCNPIEALPS